MSKSGTIIIVDDNKGADCHTNPFKKLFLKGRCTLLACHPDERPTGGNTGSGIAGHEFHIGHQYRQ